MKFSAIADYHDLQLNCALAVGTADFDDEIGRARSSAAVLQERLAAARRDFRMEGPQQGGGSFMDRSMMRKGGEKIGVR